MAFVRPKDRVLEHSTTAGAGPYALAGAVDTSYNAFSSAMAVGDFTIGAIIEPGVAFASGVLTYSATNQITLTTTYESKGTFGSGTKEIMMGLPASRAIYSDRPNAFSSTNLFGDQTSDASTANWGYATITGNANAANYPSTADFRAKVRASVAGVGTFNHTGDASYKIVGIYGWVPTGGHGASALAGFFDRPDGIGHPSGHDYSIGFCGAPYSGGSAGAIVIQDWTSGVNTFIVDGGGNQNMSGALTCAGTATFAGIAAAAKVHVGTVTPGSSTILNVAGRALFTSGAADPNDGSAPGVTIGYNTSSDYGFVDSIWTGNAGKSLRINPNGQGTTSFGGPVVPIVDNSKTLGDASHRWSTVYAGTGTINTSNAVEKTELADIDDRLLLAALDTPHGQYQWLASVAEKGADRARIHFGTTAQAFRDACVARGVDPKRFAGYCEDAVFAEVSKTQIVKRQKMVDVPSSRQEVVIEDGKPVRKTVSFVDQQPAIEMVQVHDEDGGKPVMIETPDPENEGANILSPLLYPVPVMEEVEQEYMVSEKTGGTQYGLRYDQFDRLVGYARWRVYRGELSWTPPA